MKDKELVLEMHSKARIELCREIAHNWPSLSAGLAESDSQEWPDQLGYIAGFCNITMDGFYSKEQLEDLTDKLVWKLRGLRQGISTGSIGVALDAAGAPLGVDLKRDNLELPPLH